MTKSKKAKSLVSTAIITAVLMAGIYYLALPAVNLGSPGFWWFLFFTGFVFAAIASIKYGISYKFGDSAAADEFHQKVCGLSWLATCGLLVIIIVLAIISAMCWPGTNQAACKTAEITKTETIVGDFPDLSDAKAQANLPLVDMDTAITLGDKQLAGLKNASWYEVDKEYNLIKYQGKYYRLSVIDYSDSMFKYFSSCSHGTPGYVLVECTPENGVATQTSSLVELEEPIKYTPGAFWGHDLRRHLRGQYPGYMFDSSFLEIDEEGTPYWVTGVKRSTCGVWGVQLVRSFILTNAQTGESNEYDIEDAPEWIDHVYSLDYLMTLADWHYKYQDGWWNSWTSQTGVWKTSYSYRDKKQSKEDGKFANFYGYSSTVIDGQVVFYTGLTAANKAESNLGWLTIDASSGKMTEYAVVGAEESSAQAAVEQLVAAQGYQATFPLPANIAGEASYVMCLKGNAGLVQGYAICNMENYSIAVQAATLPEAVDMYLARLGQKPTDSSNTTTPAAPATKDEASPSLFDESKVVESYSVEINGTTQYYYVLDDGSLYCVVRVK